MTSRKTVTRVGGQTVQFPAGDALLLTGALDDPAAVTLASAATVNIGAAASSLIRISGTAAITSLGTAPAGVRRKLMFLSSGVVLTYNATTLQLPTSANITAAANDTVDAYSLGSGNWLLHGYQRFSGSALVSSGSTNTSVFGEMKTLPSRTIVIPGVTYADGQLLSNASTQYPDAYAALQQATPPVPVTTAALWLSDPTMRGYWAVDTANNQIRVPDYNGRQSGSIGPVVFRADGTLGFAPGAVRQDQIQNITADALVTPVVGLLGPDAVLSGAFKLGGSTVANRNAGAAIAGSRSLGFDASLVARTGTETFPTHVVGVWGVVLFGAVINAGAADASALATSYANLSSRVQALENGGQVDYTIIYPNGGTAASPASISPNSRYISPNPFPGHPVICEIELLYQGAWERPGWASVASGTQNSSGAKANMRKTATAEEIITQTGSNNLLSSPIYTGGTFTGGAYSLPLPVRVHVWRVKG